MSGGENSETLFSFELLVEYIRLEKDRKVSDELALGVRLLDFPTLLIYQPQQSSGGIREQQQQQQQQQHGKHQQGEHAFNRGKSCLFKMNLNSLHTHLSNTPLYAMVLDVKEDIPKLVGTSLISLATVTGRIRQDVAERGASSPSSHGERGLVGVCDLKGEKIGSICLSYKLLSLGASLLPHIAERRGLESTTGGQHVRESNISTELLPPDCEDVCSPTPEKPDVSGNIQTNKPRSQTPQTLNDTDDSFEEDLTRFCPPHLFYCNPEEESKNKGGDCTLLNLDSEAFTFEDTSSEEEAASSPKVDRRQVRHDVKTSINRETSGAASNVLGEALRQLPLLNALLVELSQLNGQNPHTPLSIHPNLSWIYRPASTEPGNTARKAHTKSNSPRLKHLHPPRNCSTPVVRPASVKGKQEEALIESKSTSPRKKLVYGTTKTFNLRLKQISPLKVKRRECVEAIQSDTQAKGKTKSKIMKPSRRKSELKQSSSLNENIETMIQNITVDSARQETITLKQKNLQPDRESPRFSEKASLSERDLKGVHIPSVESGGVAQNKDKNEHLRESNQSESDRHRERASGSSRHSSPESWFSSGGGNEEADYADDFNSLEASDAYSPDPLSSPEPSRAKTPKSPVRPGSGSGSEGPHERAALPVPVKAPGSPQRALRGTHLVRPRTRASALSFSSSDGDRDGSASLRTVCSLRRATDGGSRVERSSGADSFTSPRGQRSGSPARGFSAESISSFEPQEAEELEDELGSLDFRKEYQHISQLVSNKLPGYTM